MYMKRYMMGKRGGGGHGREEIKSSLVDNVGLACLRDRQTDRKLDGW